MGELQFVQGRVQGGRHTGRILKLQFHAAESGAALKDHVQLAARMNAPEEDLLFSESIIQNRRSRGAGIRMPRLGTSLSKKVVMKS
jgi:hypothetical protein